MFCPSGSRIKVFAPEGSDAILPCSLSTKENIEQNRFNWKKVDPNKQEVFRYDGGLHYNDGLPGQDEHFRGRVSHFPLELQSGNASIIIKNTVVPDSGNYTCDLPLQQKQTFSIELVVGEYFSFNASGKKPSLKNHISIFFKCWCCFVHTQLYSMWKNKIQIHSLYTNICLNVLLLNSVCKRSNNFITNSNLHADLDYMWIGNKG